MSDAAIFVFGLVATLFTLGPLTIAAISEARERSNKASSELETRNPD